MPDLDRIESAVLHPWRRAARLLRGGASAAEVGKAVVQGTAESCRRGRGFPALAEWLTILVKVRNGQLPLAEAFDRIDRLESELGHSRHGKLAARAVRDSLIEGPPSDSRPLDVDLSLELLDRFLYRLVDHGFYDRVASEVLGARLATVEAVEARLGEIRRWTDPHRRSLAQALLGRPDGAVRAPPIRLGPRQNLAELLAEPL